MGVASLSETIPGSKTWNTKNVNMVIINPDKDKMTVDEMQRMTDDPATNILADIFFRLNTNNNTPCPEKR